MPDATAAPASPQEAPAPPVGDDPMAGGPMAENPKEMPEAPVDGSPMAENPEEMPEAPGDIESPIGGEQSEDDEKKKNIESETGELCQSLNTYKTPDEELDKYVKGMVDAALEKRKKEQESEEQSLENSPEGQMPQMESIRFTKKQINTLYESLNPVDDEANKAEREVPMEKEKKTTKKTPFDVPKFK